MMMRRKIGILGAALLLSSSAACVSSAQEQGPGTSTSENESAKHKSFSQTYETPEVKRSEERRVGKEWRTRYTTDHERKKRKHTSRKRRAHVKNNRKSS